MNADVAPSVPVAIIGIGCLFPQAEDLRRYWANILARVDAITEVPPTHWKPEDYFNRDPKTPDHTYATRGGFLDPIPFPPLEFGITPNALEATDSTQLLGLVVARQALDHAGYGTGGKSFDRRRTSVILGVTGTLELVIPLGARLGHPHWRRALQAEGLDETTVARVMQRIAESYVGWQEDSFPGLLGNVVAGRIANRLDLGGTNCVVDAACASSLSAMHLAILELTSGRSEMVLGGGMDTFNDIFMYMCFSKTPALSPSGNSRPFDRAADGTILGEGLGCVVMKRLADAERDGDRIYAVIRAMGTSSDGKGHAIYAPSPSGQVKALRQAYELAGITPDTIELVEAHGTGTRAGDLAEVTALSEVYSGSAGDNATPWCALGSVKSMIGHTKAAAGAAGLIKAALALHHKVLPPTIKVDNPLEPLTAGNSPFYVNTEKRPWLPRTGHPRRAAVSAFGFGGSNFHCVLEEYLPASKPIDWHGDVQIVAFSASDRSQLRKQVEGWLVERSWKELCLAAHQTRQTFSVKESARLLLVLEKNRHDLPRLREQLHALWQREGQGIIATPDGLYLGTGTPTGKLAFLFPGQGSQYVGMGRDLACHFPQMLATLTEASGDALPRLSDLIYPLPAFTEEDRRRREENLRATDVAQPALGALALGALQVLAHFGIYPDGVAGHSYGELVALFAAGCFDANALHQLSRVRGRLMAQLSGDRGGMLAVRAPLTTVEQLLQEEKLDLVLANRNAPQQSILSGTTAEIARAIQICGARGLACTRLPVAAAFHSRLVAEVRHPLRAELERIPFRSPQLPVYANTTAQPYPADVEAARALLAGQLAEPVAFLDLIEQMYRDGFHTFVEVGASNKLTGLVGAILGERSHAVCAIDASSGKRSGMVDLARTLAHLAAGGFGVELSRWEEGMSEPQTGSKKPGLVIPICGANHVAQRTEKDSTPRPSTPSSSQNSASIVAPTPQANGMHPRPSASQSRSETPVVTTMTPTAVPPVADPVTPLSAAGLSQALRVTQDGLITLQKMSEQTAQLHRQFLEGQDRALQVVQSLLQQQQALMNGGIPTPVAPAQPAPSQPARAMVPTPSPAVPAASPLVPESRPEVVAPTSSQGSTARPAVAPTTVPMQFPAATNSRIRETLLGVVAEKTGYPTEMLELDMELDADLGIDSIKRVEIFSALQEKLPAAPPVKSEHLGTLRTLRQVLAFLDNGSFNDVEKPAASAPNSALQTSAPLNDTFKETLLGIVAEKTGYPPEMLELDMELDADLGIDSIKRVEIFSAVQEKLPSAPPVKSEHLGTLRTLRQVLTFLGGNENEKSVPNAARQEAAPVSAPSVDALSSTVLGIVAEKTGYPPEMLELDMELDADLGIDSIKRVEIFSAVQEKLPSAPPVKSEHLGTLRTLRQVLTFLAGTSISAPVVEPATPVTSNSVSRAPSTLYRAVLTSVPLEVNVAGEPIKLPVGATIWVTHEESGLASAIVSRLNQLGYQATPVSASESEQLEVPTTLAGVIVVTPPRAVCEVELWEILRLVQRAAPVLRQSAQNGHAMLGTVSRLDGAFGLRATMPTEPLTGGLAGLTKTVRQEWPEVHCKALDVDVTWTDADEAALAVVEELFRDGPVEVGLSGEGRTKLRLVERAMPAPNHRPLQPGDVVLITGGARGVTAAVAEELARAFAPTLILLGRTNRPALEPDWLVPLQSEQEIKRAILQHSDTPLTPRQVQDRYHQIQAEREITGTLRRIQSLGGKAVYYSVDVRNANAVRTLVEEIHTGFGAVRGVIHGAGVLADRRIEDKTHDQFQRVFDTKVGGVQHLLAALAQDPLQILVLFSSSTGRFGRAGQVDYAMANEVLNKLAWEQKRLRPDCRVVAVNWGPWEGGMVTPALQKVFASEGIGLIPLDAGARLLVQEISQMDDPAVEVVVMGGPWPEFQPTPALTLEPTTSLTLAFEREMTVDQYPFLQSHVLNQRAVLPMAVILEWLAQGAMHSNPGLAFHGCNELRVFKGVLLDAGQTLPLRVLAGKAIGQPGGMFLVKVELRSVAADREFLHARGEIVLANQLPATPAPTPVVPLHPYPHSLADVYQRLLFHGPDLQGLERIEGASPEGMSALVAPAPTPSAWIRQPLRQSWIADPLVLDASFQMMCLWCHQYLGSFSLPCFAGNYRQYRRAFPREGARVQARITQQTPQRVLVDLDYLDRNGVLIARLENYECVVDASLNEAFRRNRLPVSPAGGKGERAPLPVAGPR